MRRRSSGNPGCSPRPSRKTSLLPQVTLCKNAYEACEGADALVIVTEWNQFRMLDLERVHGLMNRALVVDLRNVYDPDKVEAAGFEYESVGR